MSNVITLRNTGGFTRMDNDLMEALAAVHLSPAEFKTLHVIARLTVGFSRDEHRITAEDIAKRTHILPAHVSRAISKLLARRIIYRVGGSRGDIGICSPKEWIYDEPKKDKSIQQKTVETTKVGNSDSESKLPNSNVSLLYSKKEDLPLETVPSEQISAPQGADHPPVEKSNGVSFNGEEFQVDHDLITKWAGVYAPVDVETEISRAAVWAAANPRKAKKDWRRFLVNWMAKRAAKAVSEAGVPVDKIIDLYHRACPNLPAVSVVGDKVLRALIVERWNESEKHQGQSVLEDHFRTRQSHQPNLVSRRQRRSAPRGDLLPRCVPWPGGAAMIELHSLEAEHGVIGAMLIQPQLVDVISDGLSPDAFAYAENADLYRLILDLCADGKPVSILTLEERRPVLSNDVRTLSYAAEIQANTVGVANAKEYARIVSERAVRRQMAGIASEIGEIAQEPGALEDKIAQAQALVLTIDAAGSDGECQMIGDILRDHIEVIQERHDRAAKGEAIDGLKSGIPDLDKYTQGLKPGQMIVIAGRPSMGKTTLAMNIVADVAITQKKPALVISLEMTKTQLTDRLLAAVGGIPLPNLKDGSCAHKDSTELGAATLKLRDAPIAVSDVPVMTMPRIRSIARRQKHRMGGLGVIAIDYLGLVEGDGKGRIDDVTTMSRQVKLLAREMGCPVLLLCQLNRGCESRPDKRPVLSDLRESGAIEQDADIVMFVYRDEVYHPNTQDKGIGEILIRKNRDGEIGNRTDSLPG